MRVVALLAALSVALIVGVAYAVVIIPSRSEITGNTLTAASVATTGDPFVVDAVGVFASPVELDSEATQTLTLPAACSTTSPLSQPFAIAAIVGENTVPTATWSVTCPAGEWVLSATVTVEITDPAYFDSNPDNDSMTGSITVVVEG